MWDPMPSKHRVFFIFKQDFLFFHKTNRKECNKSTLSTKIWCIKKKNSHKPLILLGFSALFYFLQKMK